MACWEFPTISLCSWPPTLHCMYKERILVQSGSVQLCQADRSACCALCCSVCTATPLFCALRWSPAATPHHCVWQTSNLIPLQFRRLSVSLWNTGAMTSEHTWMHFFASVQKIFPTHKNKIIKGIFLFYCLKSSIKALQLWWIFWKTVFCCIYRTPTIYMQLFVRSHCPKHQYQQQQDYM